MVRELSGVTPPIAADTTISPNVVVVRVKPKAPLMVDVAENRMSSVSEAAKLCISIAPVAKSTGPVKAIAPAVPVAFLWRAPFNVVDVVAV